jgi:hypothetical protein
MAGEICPVRQGGNRASGIYAFLLASDLTYSKTVPEKALTITGANRFTRRGDTCRLYAMFMNQLSVNWGIRRNCQARGLPPIFRIDNQQQVSARLVGCPSGVILHFFSSSSRALRLKLMPRDAGRSPVDALLRMKIRYVSGIPAVHWFANKLGTWRSSAAGTTDEPSSSHNRFGNRDI